MSSPPVPARTLTGVPRESRILVATNENIPILAKLTTLHLEEGASVSFTMSISRTRVLTRVVVKVETIDDIENEPVVVADFLAALNHLPPLMRVSRPPDPCSARRRRGHACPSFCSKPLDPACECSVCSAARECES